MAATDDAAYSGDYDPDVGHDFLNVTEQIFGAKTLPPAGPPAMSGFVTDYGEVSGSVSKSHTVMKCFDPKKSRYRPLWPKTTRSAHGGFLRCRVRRCRTARMRTPPVRWAMSI